MSVFQIKLLAIITMAIDHIGLFFFPQFIWLRIIGRISFPLFAWLIANGAYHTHNMKAYLARLFVFALISQIPFLLANRLIDPNFYQLNVLFTLFLGLAAIACIKQTENRQLRLVIAVIFAGCAHMLQTDYGGFGVGVVVLFYLFFNNFRYLIVSQLLMFFVPYILFLQYRVSTFEPIGLFALIVTLLYNGKPGPKATYLFYLFYPLQYVLFYFLLQRIISL